MIKTKDNVRFLWTFAVLIIYYVVGITLLKTADDPSSIIRLTPYTLLITFVLLLLNHRNWSRKLVLSLILVVVFGYLVEVLGVLTSFPFGSYYYTDVLGVQLFETPLIMGINWGLVVFAGSMVVHPLKQPVFVKSILTGLLLVCLDVFLEPFAIKWNLWQWINHVPPFQNYAAWTIIAIVFSFLIHKSLEKTMQNKLAVYVLIVQFVFFLLLRY